ADVVVLDDLPRLGPIEEQAVVDFYRGGGGLLVVLGAHADSSFWNTSLLRELGAGVLGGVEAAAPGASWRLRRTVAGHAVLAGFPARPGEPLSTATFRSVRALGGAGAGAPGAGAGHGAPARVLLEYDRQHPALLEA